MADRAISALTQATSMTSADLFAISQGGQAKKVTWETFITYLTAALDGHGGINNIAYTAPASGSLTGTLTITYADHTTASFAITNGRGITTVADKWAVSTSKTTAPTTWYNDPQTMTATNKYEWHYSIITFNDNTTLATDKAVVGVYGDTAPWYVWFKFSAVLPTQDSDLSDTPNNWIGVYSGASSTAPTSYSSYKWFQYKGEKGDTGTSITSVSLYESTGLVDTYRVEFSDETFTSFNVTNGSSISSISLTDTSGLIDTYTVTLTNGNTTTFAVHNGKGISSITEVDVTHVAGHTDVYRINFNDGDTYDFRVYNGANGSGSVSTVDGIQSVNQDVSLLQFGQGAPTTSTQGALKSRYYDQTNSILYICVGIDTSGAETTYTWQGAGVTVDDALSTSSTNPVQNAVLTALIGLNAITTTAQTLSGAINELNANKAPIASPTFTGTPKAPTASESTDNTQIATTAFANRAANNAVATYVRPNLLDNWYFVGGGSQLGDGIFPINRQGQTTYEPNQSNTFLIDRWKTGIATGKLQLLQKSMSGTNNFLIEQIVGDIQVLGGKTLTVSILTSQGLFSATDVCPTTAPASGTINVTAADIYINGSRVGYADVIVNSAGQARARIRAFEGYTVYFWAIKLELGDTQTLAHQEGNTWVLNEIPNWYETLFRCRPDLFEPVRENLLDNWYFVRGKAQDGVASFPVNQRGRNSYNNAGPSIDRWNAANANCMVVLGYNNYIVIKSSTAGAQNLFLQYLENKEMFAGKTVTISAIINSTLVQSTIQVPADSSTWGSTITPGSDLVGGCSIYLRYLNSKLCFVFHASGAYVANTNILIQAAKIEIGDSQTLAHQVGSTWVLNEIPDYVEQLAKCQRYYQRYGNVQAYRVFAIGYMQSATSARFFLPLSVPMVKKPTATVNGTLYFNYGANSTRVEITEYSVINWDDQQVFFAGTTASSIAVGTVGEIMSQNTTVESIELSAE